MFKDNVLELIVSMFVNDLQHSVGYSFSHEHKYIHNDYSVNVEIHTVLDPTNGQFSPMLSVNQVCPELQRANVLRITNKTCFSINGNTAWARQFNLFDDDIDVQLANHGFDEREIELIKSILFSINMYMDAQNQ